MNDKTGRTFWDAFSENKWVFLFIGILLLVFISFAIYNNFKVSTPLISFEPSSKKEPPNSVETTYKKEENVPAVTDKPKINKIDQGKTNSQKQTEKIIKKYQSWVVDSEGTGIAQVNIRCNTCIQSETMTDNTGKFVLNKEFLASDYFLSSEITLEKNNKVKSIVIEWRDNSPQPIIF